jgi:hypothetical protein
MASLSIEKFCNAFIPNAIPSRHIGGAAERELQRLLKKHGGLWVGGKVTIDPGGLTFTPNGMNAALHEELETVHISLTDIRSARRRFGWLTGIVEVEHNEGLFKFRCFGAKQVAETLFAYVTKP